MPRFIHILQFHSMSSLKLSKSNGLKDPVGKPALISNGVGPLSSVSDKVSSPGSCVANMSDITASDPSVVVIGSSMADYVGFIVASERCQASSISLAVVLCPSSVSKAL